MTMNHEAFRARQTVIELEGVVNFPVRVAYTDIGEGEPIVLHAG